MNAFLYGLSFAVILAVVLIGCGRTLNRPQATAAGGRSNEELLQGTVVIGSLAVPTTTNASVSVVRPEGPGWRIKMTASPDESLVAQPIDTQSGWLLVGMEQEGGAIYIGKGAPRADQDWARAYTAWQDRDVADKVDAIVEGRKDSVAPSAPGPHVLEGVLMRASAAEQYGYPRTDSVVHATFANIAERVRRPEAGDPWILVVLK